MFVGMCVCVRALLVFVFVFVFVLGFVFVVVGVCACFVRVCVCVCVWTSTPFLRRVLRRVLGNLGSSISVKRGLRQRHLSLKKEQAYEFLEGH